MKEFMRRTFFTTKLPYIILGIWAVLWLFRLRYFTYSMVPLGYDPGMYKEIFSHYRNVITSMDFSLLPQRVRHEPLLWILAALGNKLWVSFDRMLTRGIGIINLIPGVLLFWYFKTKSKNLRRGVFAALLYRTSIIQYQVFYRWYFKQTLGVSIMILILILWEKKKVLFQSILFFLLILLHKHTALYVWAILAISTIIEWITTKTLPWKKIVYRTIAGGCALLIYIPLRGRIMTEAVKAVGDGSGWDFITPILYLKYSRPIIILSILGAWRRIKLKKFDVWLVWYGVWIVWILLSLVNYNRTLVFLDAFVVIFAAYFLFKVFQLRSGLWTSLIFIGLLGWSTYYIVYVNDHAIPLISQEEFISIKNLSKITQPNALVMNTHRNYTPWIMGRSQRDYINPGMSDMDLWTHQQRNQRRSVDGKQKCEMLKATYAKLSRPLYIRLWSQQFRENLSWWYCFLPVTGGTTWIVFKVSLQ